jgi:hypothetical protein
MTKFLATVAVPTTLATSADACDMVYLSATANVYEKVCKKLPTDYLKAVVKSGGLDKAAMADQLEQAKDPDYCQNNAETIELSIAYFKKHPKAECL